MLFLKKCFFVHLEDDSDDDTTFGDDDEEKDNDRFGRVEQLRAELESDIGLEKLVQVYEIIKVNLHIEPSHFF